MTLTTPPSDRPSTMFAPRHRDRRLALGDMLMTMSRVLGERSDLSLLRGAFEEMLRRTVPVRSVRLRDANSRWAGRPESSPGAESISLQIPASASDSQHTLEATFDPGSALGEWDFQLLGFACHLAALVLEIERGRALLARGGTPTVVSKGKRDGAAPLIGSTMIMRELRSQVERVATTDFTVLLEGGSGR